MSDTSYQTKVYKDQNGDLLTVAPGGVVNVEDGGALQFAGKPLLLRTKKIPITAAPTGSEQDTGWDLPAKAVLLDVIVDVTTAEATGATKTIDVGLLSSESGGDADGFVAGLSVAATGLKRGQATVTGGVFSANTRGVLMSKYAAGANSDDRGQYVELPHLATAVTAKSVSYTSGSAFTQFRGSLYLIYAELG